MVPSLVRGAEKGTLLLPGPEVGREHQSPKPRGRQQPLPAGETRRGRDLSEIKALESYKSWNKNRWSQEGFPGHPAVTPHSSVIRSYPFFPLAGTDPRAFSAGGKLRSQERAHTCEAAHLLSSLCRHCFPHRASLTSFCLPALLASAFTEAQ